MYKREKEFVESVKFEKDSSKALTCVVNLRYNKSAKPIKVHSHNIKESVMEENGIIKLPASELEIMQAIWLLHEEGEKFITASLVMKRCPALNRLKLTTVLTLITRLQTKGFIVTEKLGRSNCYTPIIDSADYRKFAYADFVEHVYRDNRLDLASALIGDENLTKEDLEAIKALVEKAEAAK